MEIRKVTSAVADKRLTVCMEFAARNGFGGMNVGQAVWYVTAVKSDGQFSLDQPAQWDRRCAGTKGTTRTPEALEILACLRSR